MPFVLMTGAKPPTPAQRSRLEAQICPWRGKVELVPCGKDSWLLHSSAARFDGDRLVPAVSGGTARFTVSREGDALRITTDPLGSCPLWYTRRDGGWLVAPEAKALAVFVKVTLRDDAELEAPGRRSADWSPYLELRRVPPGASLELRDGGAICLGEPPDFGRERDADDGADGVSGAAAVDRSSALAAALGRALPRGDGPQGAYVSGGIDSSVACALARRHGPVRSFSLGSEHGNEFAGARALAAELGCDHAEVNLDAATVARELEAVVFGNEVFDGLAAEILLQFAVLHRAAEGSCRRIATGYGADLLFDGMLRHAAYLEAAGVRSTVGLLERTRFSAEIAPFLGWSRGLAVDHPFLAPEVIDVALRIPAAMLDRDGIGKRVLRDAAVGAGWLSKAAAFRPKVGLSDGTGANRLLSDALGLASPHAYREKSRRCAAILRSVLARASTSGIET